MLLACCLMARAAVFNVEPGTNVRTIAETLAPGDVLVFQDGVFELDGPLVVQGVAGEEATPVEIRAQSGASPVLKATGNFAIMEIRESSWISVTGLTFEGNDLWETEGGQGVVLRDVSNVRFEGNEIRNTRNSTLVLSGDGTALTVRGNHLHHSADGHGIYAGCGDAACWLSGSTIEGNLIHDQLSEGARYGIVLDNGSQGNLVADNVLYGGYHGIRVESTQLGEPNLVEGNVVWGGRGNGMELTGAARVRNNLVFEMAGYGLWSTDHENGDLADLVISYNTVALTGGYAVRLEDWWGREGMVFSSNAIANITGEGLYHEPGDGETTNYLSRNVVSGLVEGIDVALYPNWFAPGSGLADFADAPSWDYYPRQTGGLVGQGDPAGEAWIPEVDFNGSARNGANPTVGAYEWTGGASNPGWLVAEEFKETDSVNDPGSTQIPKGGCCGGGDSPAQAWLLLPLLPLALRRRV